MPHAHHHSHDHPQGHARAQRTPAGSPLRASALARLGVVVAMLTGLWAAVFWAMA